MTDLTPNDLRLISLVFWVVVIALLLIGVALTQPKRNHRVRPKAARHPWPRQGHDETRGYFATSERPGPECAGKVS